MAVEVERFPKRAVANAPRNVVDVPVVFPTPAEYPIAELYEPVVLRASDPSPKALLKEPRVLLLSD